jgi:hypothetical protein
MNRFCNGCLLTFLMETDDCLASIQGGLEASKAALDRFVAHSNTTAAGFKRSNIGARDGNATAATRRFTARDLSQGSNQTIARGLYARDSNSTIAARGLASLSSNSTVVARGLLRDDETEENIEAALEKMREAVKGLNETVARDTEIFPQRRGRMIRHSL